MTWMLVRLVLSLAFVGLVLWFAARVAKKRGLGGGGNQGLIEVVARQQMGRSSTLNVVRIGDVVLVVGATEEQVTLLAEVDPETIETPTGPREAVRVPAPARAPARQVAEAPRHVPSGYAEDDYAHDPYDGGGHAGSGYDGGGYDDRHPADGYADQQAYAEHGYTEAPYAERRTGGQHADGHHYDGHHADGHHYDGHRPEGPRHGGGTRRPAVAPSAASGALAGSVFDKNGWGTFVNELRERTVRRP